MNVHRGHGTGPPGATGGGRLPLRGNVSSLTDNTSVLGWSRLAVALIAAFRTVVKGGLIPHAKHGGKWVAEVAVAGSKFEGTGLENEHMGHIQVALIGFEDADFCCAMVCGSGESGLPEERADCEGAAGLAVALRDLSGLLF